MTTSKQEEYFTKIQLSNKNSAIIHTKNWESDNPEVQVLFQEEESHKIYSGTVDRAQWKIFAECFEQDEISFFEQNKLALINTEESQKFKFSVKKLEENKILLSWAKSLESQEGVLAKCGEILLSLSNSHIFDFIQNCVGLISSLSVDLQKEQEKSKKLAEESSALEVGYEKILQTRIAAEEQLLAKFNALLNSKKRKIRDLEEEQY